MRRIAFPLVFALCACSFAQNSLPERIARVEAAIEKHMAERKVTGASVAISEKGSIVFQKGFGFADLENDVPYKSETVNRLGSISKVITAIAVMQLVEAGKIDLDEDIRKYVPEFPDKGVKITARHILTHTSGIRHYKPLEADNMLPMRTVLQSFPRFVDDPLVHKPGEKYTYSTYAYSVLARAVETASGKTFKEYLDENVFAKAGMASSGLEDLRAIVKHRTRGYERLPDGRLVNSEYADISYKWAGGGMVSTVPDLCALGNALLQGKLMKPETLALMWTKQKLSDGREIDRALGWQAGEFRGNPIFVHGGAQQMAKTFFVVSPKDQIVLAVLTNYESHDPGELARRVRDAWYGPAARL